MKSLRRLARVFRRLPKALWRRRQRLVLPALLALESVVVLVLGLVRADPWLLAIGGLGCLGVALWAAPKIYRRLPRMLRKLPGGANLALAIERRERRLVKEGGQRLDREMAQLREQGKSLEALNLMMRSRHRHAVAPTTLRRLSGELRRQGYFSDARRLLADVVARKGLPGDAAALRKLDGSIAFLRGEGLPSMANDPGFQSVSGRVLHVVKRSLADAQAGYTIRTHRTAVAQLAAGYDVHVVTHLGIHDPSGDPPLEWLQDGVSYHRLAGPSISSTLENEWLSLHIEALAGMVAELRPEILHAASDFVNARAARVVGNAFGIPVVYEVRGFWEETMMSSLARKFAWRGREEHDRRHGQPDSYGWRQQSEEQEWRLADAVVTLAPGMADKIAAAGVPRERITIVPNAIDPAEFAPVPRDLKLLRSLGFREDTTVVGYVSSLSEYEGIDVLIRAFARLRSRTRQGGIGLLIVGAGAHRAALDVVVEEVGAEGIVFTGSVPHTEVTSYYGLLDVFVVPRLPVAVCRLVTPLKPYEAFALQRAVVMSDVEALAGIAAESGAAELARAADDRDLARVLERLIDDDEGRVAMGRRARDWVTRERTWDRNASLYAELYERLTSGAGGSSPRPTP